MIKCRLRACLLPLFTGDHGLISHKASLILPNRCYTSRAVSNVQLKSVESLKPSSDDCIDEEDDFAELGAPIKEQHVSAIRNLMTEKPEPLKKCGSARKASSSSSETIKKLMSMVLERGNSGSAPCLKTENDTDISDISLPKKYGSNFESSTSVTIEYVPSIVKLFQLKEAMSTFGKISNASMRVVPSSLDCCDIEFESVESKSKAVSAGWITVKNLILPIHPLHVFDIVSVRISNISPETDDSSIRSICMSCATLEELVREKDVAVAAFSVKDKSDTRSILKSLNKTTMDGCKWSARSKTSMPKPVATPNDDNADRCLGLKVSSQIEELRRQISLTNVYVEDLEYLHQSILHIQSRPTTGNNLSSAT